MFKFEFFPFDFNFFSSFLYSSYHFIFYIFSFLWGAVWGSFGGTIIYRSKEGISILSPSSFCPKCKNPIAWKHKIPILSYIALRGRCVYCGGKISPIYFILEFLSGVLAVSCVFFSGSFIEFLVNFLFFWGLLTGAISDIFYMAVPLPAILFSTFASFASIFFPNRNILDVFGGIIFAAGTLFAIKFLYKIVRKKEGLGEGDIISMIPVGAFLGFFGSIYVFIISSFLGGLVAFVLSLLGLKGKDDPLPFVPFIFVGTLMTFLILRFT